MQNANEILKYALKHIFLFEKKREIPKAQQQTTVTALSIKIMQTELITTIDIFKEK